MTGSANQAKLLTVGVLMSLFADAAEGRLPPMNLERTWKVEHHPEAPEAGILLCPRCKGGSLNHAGVATYERKEDEPNVLLTVVENRRVLTQIAPSELSGNPSERRDAVVISFWCEDCGDNDEALLYMELAQHHGETLISWRYNAELYQD